MSPESQPNFTLDPQGFRGTSTARRLRQSRQRQQLRTLMFVLLLLCGAVALGWYYLQPRAQGFAVVKTRQLPLDLDAPATMDSGGNLWLASRGGALWQIGADGLSQRYGLATNAAAPPFNNGSDIYVPGLDGTLTAFAAPGPARWTRDLGGALSTTPQLWRAGDATALAVGDSDGRIMVLNADNGKTLWKVYLGGAIGNALAATREGFVAPTLANGIWRGGLVSLDGKTGRVMWRYPQNQELAAGVATPLFDEASNRIYWNNDEGRVASLEASSGRVIWQTEVAPAAAPLAVMLRAQPVLLGQSVFVGGNDGILRSLDAANGNARWNVDLKAPVRALSAANFDGRPAILAVSKREIILVDAGTGRIIGRDAGTMAWLVDNGKGAIIVGENGNWRRVRW